ncbi:hypothetical protein [Clostridium perfringens]|uniref:hypothetical protein n=1 Tax=Clostridium perfringens TaxID=1502 RepID=UPI000423ECBF|nr:hypothetical protein [Clostridium perfringens]EJT6478467.1 hypothetical protein [Clostridium perfringens]
MAQGNRSKEIWLIPKRGSLHQTICLIDGIIERNYSRSTWNPQKQNNLGVNLKKWGATNSGKNISPQAIRTLTASIPQYLGFLYINTSTTPNTICLTKAGENLWNKHKDDLVKINNLREDKDKLITQSSIVLKQMEKLQITNPIIKKDCSNILVFPFRMTLKLILELGYLDREEIAYIVFGIKDESEYDLALKEIKNLRKLELFDRKEIINSFKETHIGNITLVQAPSASYYESLCTVTGIIEKNKVEYPNPGNESKLKVNAIRIKEGLEDYVRDILNEKYNDASVYDFGDNLNLWIEYIGDPNRLEPPKDIKIDNKSNSDVLVCISKDGQLLDGDLVRHGEAITHPMFINEEYSLECIDIESGEYLSTQTIIPNSDEVEFTLNISSSKSIKADTMEDIAKEILEHSSSKFFGKKMLNYLSILCKIDGKDRSQYAVLKGAYYEYLFFKLLLLMQEEGIIDDVIWNGKVGEYGLPTSAPGGKTGTCDMVFTINEISFVLELTTIRPKSTQFNAEGASVPDHIRLYKNQVKKDVIGIFCAPQIHERNKIIMETSLLEDNIKLNSIKDSDLLNLFMSKDRDKIVSKLS